MLALWRTPLQIETPLCGCGLRHGICWIYREALRILAGQVLARNLYEVAGIRTSTPRKRRRARNRLEYKSLTHAASRNTDRSPSRSDDSDVYIVFIVTTHLYPAASFIPMANNILFVLYVPYTAFSLPPTLVPGVPWITGLSSVLLFIERSSRPRV